METLPEVSTAMPVLGRIYVSLVIHQLIYLQESSLSLQDLHVPYCLSMLYLYVCTHHELSIV